MKEGSAALGRLQAQALQRPSSCLSFSIHSRTKPGAWGVSLGLGSPHPTSEICGQEHHSGPPHRGVTPASSGVGQGSLACPSGS